MKPFGYLVVLLFILPIDSCGLKPSQEKKIPQEVTIEFYARQFDWTARFPGKDNKLGKTDFRLTTDKNIVGMITPWLIDEAVNKLIVDLDSEKASLIIYSDDSYHGTDLLYKTEKRLNSVRKLKEECANMDFTNSNDDIIIRQEIHLPVGDTIDARFRSKDVIHGAYFPHFRVQTKCVPGITTRVRFSISITTEEMRKKMGNPKFDYMLLCNNICGASHFSMQMKVVVESREDFEKWLANQKTVGSI